MMKERHCDSCGKSMGVMDNEHWSAYKTRGGHKCSACFRRMNPNEARKELDLFDPPSREVSEQW